MNCNLTSKKEMLILFNTAYLLDGIVELFYIKKPKYYI
jgi:hypothetical protein